MQIHFTVYTGTTVFSPHYGLSSKLVYSSADGTAFIAYAIPAGSETCYVQQWSWTNGGYYDVYAYADDNSYLWLNRVNTYQTDTHVGAGSHSGVRIDKIGSGLSIFDRIEIYARKGITRILGVG